MTQEDGESESESERERENDANEEEDGENKEEQPSSPMDESASIPGDYDWSGFAGKGLAGITDEENANAAPGLAILVAASSSGSEQRQQQDNRSIAKSTRSAKSKQHSVASKKSVRSARSTKSSRTAVTTKSYKSTATAKSATSTSSASVSVYTTAARSVRRMFQTQSDGEHKDTHKSTSASDANANTDGAVSAKSTGKESLANKSAKSTKSAKTAKSNKSAKSSNVSINDNNTTRTNASNYTEVLVDGRWQKTTNVNAVTSSSNPDVTLAVSDLTPTTSVEVTFFFRRKGTTGEVESPPFGGII